MARFDIFLLNLNTGFRLILWFRVEWRLKKINNVPFHPISHQIWLYHRIQRCRLSGKRGLVGGYFLEMWVFSKVEIWKVGCLVINSASSWLVQSTQIFFCWKINPRSWLPLKTGLWWRHLDRKWRHQKNSPIFQKSS